jgi:hypothetical protein
MLLFIQGDSWQFLLVILETVQHFKMTRNLCARDKVHFQNGDFVFIFLMEKSNVYLQSFYESLDSFPGYSLV